MPQPSATPVRRRPATAFLLVAGLATTGLAACSNLDPYAWSRGSESRGSESRGSEAGGAASGTTAPGRDAGAAAPRPGTSATAPAVSPGISAGAIPAAVQPPATARERLRTVAIGDLTYECRRHLLEPTRFVWSFVVPNATLYDEARRPVGRYYAGPTWEGNDRSKVTGRQVGSVRAAGNDLPLQLIKAEVSTGNGIMKGVSYIPRLNISGGIPDGPCGPAEAGRRQQVKFQADYIFFQAAGSAGGVPPQPRN